MKKAGFIFLLSNALLAIARTAYGATGLDTLPNEQLGGKKPFGDSPEFTSPDVPESIRGLTSAEQLALSYALNASGGNQTSEISYNVESLSQPSTLLRASRAAPKTAMLKVDVAGETLEIPMPESSKCKIPVSKVKRGRNLADEIEEEEVDLDVATGIIDTLSEDGKTGCFACVTQTYNATTQATTVNGLIWTNSSITTIKTYEIDGVTYKVTLTTPRAAYEKGIKPHKHIEHESDQHGNGRMLSIPTLGGKPLINVGFAFTSTGAREVGDALGYAINIVEIAKSIYKAQGITGFTFKVAKIFIGQSAADAQYYGPIDASWKGMSWAGRFISGDANINLDAVHAIVSDSELEPGIGGIAYVGCGPYIFQGKILGRKNCASCSDASTSNVLHELFGHLLGRAGHEKRYNINEQYYDTDDPSGAAFAFVSPDEQYGTLMSYHYPVLRYSQNGASFEGKQLGSKIEDNVRMIKFWLPQVVDWRNYAEVTDGPTSFINPTRTPSVRPTTRKPTSMKPTRTPSRRPTTKAPTGRSTTFLTRFPTKAPTSRLATHAPTFDQTPTLTAGQSVALKYTGAAGRNFVLKLDDKIITFKPGANNIPQITVQKKVGTKVTTLSTSQYYLDQIHMDKLTKLFSGVTVFRIMQVANEDGTYSSMLAFDHSVTKTVRGKPVTTTNSYPILTLMDKTNVLNVACDNPQYVQVSGIQKFGRLLEEEQHEDGTRRRLTTVNDEGRIEVSFAQMRDWQPNSDEEKDIAFTAIMDIYARSSAKLYEIFRAITDYTLDGYTDIKQYDEFMENVMPKIFSRASTEVIDEFIQFVCANDINAEHKEGYKAWLMDFVEKSKKYHEDDEGYDTKHHSTRI